MKSYGTVMVVDDSAFARRALADQLYSLGFRVIQATNGTEAIERYTAEDPDLVILDMVMPGPGGLEVLRQLKELDPQVCVIFATADIQLSTLKTAITAGAKALINKPIKKERLMATIANAACPKLAHSL